jgi:hypothetical protein
MRAPPTLSAFKVLAGGDGSAAAAAAAADDDDDDDNEERDEPDSDDDDVDGQGVHSSGVELLNCRTRAFALGGCLYRIPGRAAIC